MKKTLNILLVATLTMLLISCKDSKPKQLKISEILGCTEDGRQIITNKIMYDVPIVNEIIGDRSKNNPDWFWQNLPSPEGDDFIKNLFDDAINGRLKICYYDDFSDYETFEIIPENKIKDYISTKLTYQFEIIDTNSNTPQIINLEIKLDHTNIKELRFLEEWYIYNGCFNKRVIAIAPFFSIEHPTLNETLKTAHFWILMIPENNSN